MEISVQNLVKHPARYACAAHGGHFLRANRVGILINVRYKPWWDTPPIFPDIEREIVDRAVEARKSGRVLVIIEGGFRHREALRCDGILELCYLGFFFKVVLLYFGVFLHCLAVSEGKKGLGR